MYNLKSSIEKKLIGEKNPFILRQEWRKNIETEEWKAQNKMLEIKIINYKNRKLIKC